MKSAQWMWSALLCALAGLICSSVVEAQSFPRLKPIPPRGPRVAAAAAAVAAGASASSPWEALTNPPPFTTNACNGGFPGAANPLLLTDGSVIIQDAGCPDWLRLTPDRRGSYANGTWTHIASLPPTYAPLYHSSAVLPDGRVIIMGGEYDYYQGSYFVPIRTAQGAIYDPVTNVWAPVAPPPFFTPLEISPFPPLQTIGDAASVVLADGTYMQADCCTKQAALLDSRTLAWRPTGAGKFDTNSEEGWTLLPGGDVLTVDAGVPFNFPYIPTLKNSELYNPRTGTWSSGGSTVVQLWDSAAACGGESVASFEIGPAVLRPYGDVFYTGANSCGPANTASFDAYSRRWMPGPVFPDDLDIADGPAALEPNGKVLMMASPGIYQTPSTFLEYDGRQLVQVPGTPNAPYDTSYYGNMLVLPTGQILLTDFSEDIELYTPRAGYRPEWQPIIFFVSPVLKPDRTYEIVGIGFNGRSQGAAYGDDVQAATNYPLVRIINVATGHVFYSRTHDHSSMAVASPAIVTTHFDVPAGQEPGLSRLEVVANGIPSEPFEVWVEKAGVE